ncbi:MAG: AbrB family transcriptional regulator [Deltaproteobacteria bacterium RBG_16_50_11]|nr:MAG: AbrB family transcriptional regulator [Deltaproteobacteria bacterium RBG_16_50_11]
MLAKKTSKNQITLPQGIANAFPDTEYFDVSIKDNGIVLMPVKITPAVSVLESVREKMRKLGTTGKDVKEAIRWARRKR